MQNKMTQHKRSTLYAIKKSSEAVKSKRNDKRLYGNNDKIWLCSLSPIYTTLCK